MPTKSLITILSFTLVACSNGGEASINKAIEAEVARGKNVVNTIEEGIPFYEKGDLNPTWDQKSSNLISLPEFSLLDQSGKIQTRQMLADHFSIVAFFFSSCSGFCPTLMRNLKVVANELKQEKDVQYIGLSVDPETDTPAVLKLYRDKLNLKPVDKWKLLTGNRDTIFGIAKNTLSSEVFKKQVTGPKSIIHSENFYVFDKQGFLRGVLKGNNLATPAEIKTLVASLRN